MGLMRSLLKLPSVATKRAHSRDGKSSNLIKHSMSGLTQFDDFWGALRPKNHQTFLVFRSQCISPKCLIKH
jgi:hypothetical protein